MITRRAALAVLTLSAALVLGGCGTDATPKAGSYQGGSPTPNTSTNDQSASSTKAPKKKQKPVARPLAPAVIKPAVRNGKQQHPTVTAKGAAIDKPVKFTDGVQLSIEKITHGRVSDEGPGAVKGPTTSFTLKLRNGSSHPINLNAVIVTAVFGSPGRLSAPVALAQSQDFAGTVKPGKSATAIYSFMLSEAQAQQLSIHVDLDGKHSVAVFTGSAS